MTFKYPLSKLAFDFLATIKSNLGLIVILFVLNLNNDASFMFYLKIFAVILIVIGFFSNMKDTFFTRALFELDGVRIYTGMFSKTERFIPREKFENVQTEANVLHRLFQAQKIMLETGEASGDITLDYVKADEVEKMKAYVLSHHHEQTITIQQQKGQHILFTPTIKDILKAAIVSFSFLAIIPIAINAWQDLKVDKIINLENVQMPLWLTILLIFFAILVAFGMGLLKTFNKYYQYHISMDDERIYVQKGWFTKQSFSVRKSKVQAVVYKRSLYQRLLGVTTIKLVSTGEVAELDDLQINELFPYMPSRRAKQLVSEMLPQFTQQSMTYQASEKAKKLIWLRPPIFSIIIAILGLWHWAFYIVAAIFIVLTYVQRMLVYKNLSFTFDEQYVQATTGAFSLETIVTKRSKVIEVQFESSILQRKVNAMTMTFVNRAQPVLKTSLPDIDADLKEQLMNWFESRTQEVMLDPKSLDGELKKEAVQRLLIALKHTSNSQ